MGLPMNRAIFVAGGNLLHKHLTDYFLSKGRKIITAAFNGQLQKEEISADGLLVTYPWIPGSSLSPRNILIQGPREQGELEQAFLIYTTGKAGDPLGEPSFHKASSVTIQRLLDQKVKSYLFLFKELVSYFIDRGGGKLTVALLSEQTALRDPVTAGAYGMFRSLVTASLRAYASEPFQMDLFITESEDHAGFLNYMLDRLKSEPKQDNQFHSFPEKGGIFSKIITRRPFYDRDSPS